MSEPTATQISVTIKRTGKRVVMYGNVGTDDSRKWFERYFADEDAARKYADKRGWVVTVDPAR